VFLYTYPLGGPRKTVDSEYENTLPLQPFVSYHRFAICFATIQCESSGSEWSSIMCKINVKSTPDYLRYRICHRVHISVHLRTVGWQEFREAAKKAAFLASTPSCSIEPTRYKNNRNTIQTVPDWSSKIWWISDHLGTSKKRSIPRIPATRMVHCFKTLRHRLYTVICYLFATCAPCMA
jgi:hypothetical protein